MVSAIPRAIRSQRGQAALPVALLALALLVGVGAIARWGQASVASSRAQTAADAAALATLVSADLADASKGVLPDDLAAVTTAGETGGRLRSFEVQVIDSTVRVEVVVEVDGQRASAAAALPLLWPDPAHERPVG